MLHGAFTLWEHRAEVQLPVSTRLFPSLGVLFASPFLSDSSQVLRVHPSSTAVTSMRHQSFGTTASWVPKLSENRIPSCDYKVIHIHDEMNRVHVAWLRLVRALCASKSENILMLNGIFGRFNGSSTTIADSGKMVWRVKNFKKLKFVRDKITFLVRFSPLQSTCVPATWVKRMRLVI